MLTLRRTAMLCPKPVVLTKRECRVTGQTAYGSAPHPEELYRVIPHTAQDVSFLRQLKPGVDRFVPFHGEGLLISHNALMCA